MKKYESYRTMREKIRPNASIFKTYYGERWGMDGIIVGINHPAYDEVKSILKKYEERKE